MKKKSIFVTVMSLMLALCLTACGGPSDTGSGYGYGASYSASNGDVAQLSKSGSMSNSYDSVESYAEYDTASSDSESVVEASRQNVKLIYNGDISLETVKYNDAESYIRTCVDKYDGYFERFDVNTSQKYWSDWGGDTYRYAYITVRVPVDHFNDLMSDLQTDGDMAVVSQSVNVTDVSENYYDLEMRLDIAKASVKELEELLDKAVDVQDVIAVRQELSDAVYQVEYLQGQLNSYDSKISYSYVYINLTEVTALTMANRVSGYGNKFVESIKKGFYGGLDFLGDLILWLAANWLTLIIVVAIIIGIVRLLAWRRRIRIAKRNGTYVPKPRKVKPVKAVVNKPDEPKDGSSDE